MLAFGLNPGLHIANQLQSGLTEQISAVYRNFNFSFSIGFRPV
jgi:hypothetical protein